MNNLYLIRDLLQDFADSLARTLELEITIADNKFVRIVGTGDFKHRISQQLPVGSVYRTSITTGKPIIVDNAVKGRYCKNCEYKDTCRVAAEACAPIKWEKEVLGVIGIIALNDMQRARFLQKKLDFYNTIIKLAKLIETILIYSSYMATPTSEIEAAPSAEVITFDKILGKSNRILSAIELSKKAAQSDANVLILGETGTGKELFSRAIHMESHRRHGVLEPINCSAIPDNLLESELFGYEAGAFTGAEKRGKIGKLQFAHNGTILLDEIGDMPLNLQAKLLRFLEDKYIFRLGGVTPVRVNTRIIAATSRDLHMLIKEGRFRKDLFYRLNVISIRIPPLRERIEDLDLLAEAFLEKYSERYNKSIKGIDPSLLDRFRQYSWPGNVREFENVIEYGVLLETNPILSENSVIMQFEENEEKNLVLAPLRLIVKDMEGKFIRESLDKFKGDPFPVDRVAKALGISKATLYRKLSYSQK